MNLPIIAADCLTKVLVLSLLLGWSHCCPPPKRSSSWASGWAIAVFMVSSLPNTLIIGEWRSSFLVSIMSNHHLISLRRQASSRPNTLIIREKERWIPSHSITSCGPTGSCSAPSAVISNLTEARRMTSSPLTIPTDECCQLLNTPVILFHPSLAPNPLTSPSACRCASSDCHVRPSGRRHHGTNSGAAGRPVTRWGA